ncbi:myrosinase 1-like isoform X2 [Epargyreus clarus]|uniref:myrosinase 1-like isoform X2 n=1 Tax=Epargyreus clarus TaxID=520877 RepID=UPI003C2F032D
MLFLRAVVLGTIVVSGYGSDRRFPSGFKFGSASSAYQVEGGWNASDKGESVWDRYAHDHPDIVVNGNGDVACDSYHLWKEDIRIAHELGLHFYRFSISWTRIMPTGFPTAISETGKQYYSNLIDGLLEKGIEPVVTLYHWDLPQKLQDLGGWTNPLITDWFSDYARIIFSFYADRVKTWITINEPILICDGAYNMEFTAPRIKEMEMAPFLCNKHTLIAHAKAWRIYDTEYRHKYHGKVSLTNNLVWMEPFTPEYEDLAELALQHCAGRYAHPIFSKEGGWPPLLEKVIAEYSRKQGHVRSRLPPFTKAEKELIRGTYDFFAMNMYTSRLVRPSEPGDGPRIWFVTGSPELNITLVADPRWKVGAVSIMPAYPVGMRRQIAWLRREYGQHLPILITETGYGSLDRNLDDEERIDFISDHLEQILLSIKEDGANIIGFSVWTLMDNFEWMDGYRSRFGLYDVDFKDPMRKRTPRASAHFYSHLIKTQILHKTRVRSHRHEDVRMSKRSSNSSSNFTGLMLLLYTIFLQLFILL